MMELIYKIILAIVLGLFIGFLYKLSGFELTALLILICIYTELLVKDDKNG